MATFVDFYTTPSDYTVSDADEIEVIVQRQEVTFIDQHITADWTP